MASNRAPNRVAASATTLASSAEPGRRPWSTWTTVTSHPAAVARTSRASESRPPDTAQVTVLWTGGKLHRPSRAATIGGNSQPVPAPFMTPKPPTPPDASGRSTGRAPGSRRAWAGSRARRMPRCSSSGPPADSTASMKRSPCSYWFILASSPMSLARNRDAGSSWRRRCLSTREKRPALGMRSSPARSMVTSPCPSSRLISPPICLQRLLLLRGGDQGDEPAVVERVLALAQRLGDALEGDRGTASDRGRRRPGPGGRARGSGRAATARR